MTCEEFERVLPELEGVHNLEQEAHLRSCPTCADLLADLDAISFQAKDLRNSEEPHPRVWEAIALALRNEGLIRDSHPHRADPEVAHTIEDQEHVHACVACTSVQSDLTAITQQARSMQESFEPSPRVWNSIEIALKQEGLIRRPLAETRSVKSMRPHWRLAWLVPSAVVAMLILGTVLFQHGGGRQDQIAGNAQPALATLSDTPTQSEERELMRLVSERAPALKSAYEADLKVVDGYIRDAEESARANPQDEMAQQYLMSAYEQRAMVYEMAMNRSMR